MVGWHHRFNGMNLGKLQETVKDGGAWHAAVYGVMKSRTHNLATEQQPPGSLPPSLPLLPGQHLVQITLCCICWSPSLD